MPGFIIEPISTGLSLGESLQFQKEIGCAGLTIVTDELVDPGSMITEDDTLMVSEASVQMITETT